MVVGDSLFGVYVAEHSQLLLVVSTPETFLSAGAVETICNCGNLVGNLVLGKHHPIVRMQKLFFMTGVVLILLLSSFAQNPQPVSAPADVVLKLETEGGGQQFHLGELIPIKFSYTAKVPGTYLWVGQSSRLVGGHPLNISCSPSTEGVGTSPSSPDEVTFAQMLNAPCGGVGGSIGGGCGDCDGESPLSATALTFGVVPLNTYVGFRTPGTYACEASSAEITTTTRDEKVRPALLVKSNPIVVTIIDDPSWAHSAALAFAGAYEQLCRGDDVAEHRFLQCSDVARRLTYLDTADSLATEVKWFDGRNHGWENGFWDAIQRSSHPEEALRLMAVRIQEPDFEVSTGLLEWLASSELRTEVPNAFHGGTAAIYHAQAIDKLRKYVRLVGASLSQKDSTVLSESVKTYRTFAEQRYCEAESLIPRDEQNQVRACIGIRP